MKTHRLLVTGGLICLSISVSAQKPHRLIGCTTDSARTVSEVLHYAKCDPYWLAKALEDSNIHPSEMKLLPLGKPIMLDVVSCHLPAPDNVKIKTMALLGLNPKPVKKSTAITKKEPVVTGPVLTTGEETPVSTEGKSFEDTEVLNLREIIEALEIQARAMQEEINSLRAKPLPQIVLSPTIVSWRMTTLVAVAIAAFALGVIPLLLLADRKDRRGKYYWNVRSVKEGGKKYYFELVGSPTRKCQIAGCEKVLIGIEEVLRQHAKEHHEEDKRRGLV